MVEVSAHYLGLFSVPPGADAQNESAATEEVEDVGGDQLQNKSAARGESNPTRQITVFGTDSGNG